MDIYENFENCYISYEPERVEEFISTGTELPVYDFNNREPLFELD